MSVRTDAVPPTRTYNLTLAEHNAYYANGVLVFNCLTFAAVVKGKDVTHRPSGARATSAPQQGYKPGSWLG